MSKQCHSSLTYLSTIRYFEIIQRVTLVKTLAIEEDSLFDKLDYCVKINNENGL